MSTEGWMDEQNIVYTSNGILFMLNKEGNPENTTRWMNLEVIMLGEIIYMAMYISICIYTFITLLLHDRYMLSTWKSKLNKVIIHYPQKPGVQYSISQHIFIFQYRNCFQILNNFEYHPRYQNSFTFKMEKYNENKAIMLWNH